jgi:hypothetical protein
MDDVYIYVHSVHKCGGFCIETPLSRYVVVAALDVV